MLDPTVVRTAVLATARLRDLPAIAAAWLVVGVALAVTIGLATKSGGLAFAIRFADVLAPFALGVAGWGGWAAFAHRQAADRLASVNGEGLRLQAAERQRWETDRQRHEAEQEELLEATAEWTPVGVAPQPRIDVFGGTLRETQPESEQAGGSDVAARAPDDRAATTSRIGQASETDASGAAGAQTERDDALSQSGSPDDEQRPAEANEAPGRPDDQRHARRGASRAEGESAETKVQGSDADPSGLVGSGHGAAARKSVEQSTTSPDEGESQDPVTDPSAERSPLGGSERQPPSPEGVSEPSREPWVLTGHYPGLGRDRGAAEGDAGPRAEVRSTRGGDRRGEQEAGSPGSHDQGPGGDRAAKRDEHRAAGGDPGS